MFQCFLSLDQDYPVDLYYGALGHFTRFWSDGWDALGLSLLDQAGPGGRVGAAYSEALGQPAPGGARQAGRNMGSSAGHQEQNLLKLEEMGSWFRS